MTNIKRASTLLLIMLMSLSVAFSQVHPISSLLQNGLGAVESGQEEELMLPDPMSLNTAWWNYFENKKSGDLKQAVIDFIQRIDEESQKLPEEALKRELPKISHISANFFAYVALKEKSVTKKRFKFELKEHYSIGELLTIIHRERELSTELVSVREDIRDQDVQYRDITRDLNNRFVSYLETAEGSHARFLASLQVITLQTEQALLTERLRLLRENLSIIESESRELQDIKNVAITRLTYTSDEIDALNDRIDNTIIRLQEANTKLLREQSQLLLLPDETVEDQAVARLRNQRVAKEKINVAILEARLDMYENERDILAILSDEEGLDVERIQKNYADRQRNLEEISLKAKDWFNQNEVERSNTNALLADIEIRGGVNENSFLAGIANDRLTLIQETSVLLQKLQTEIADSQFMGRILENQLLQFQGVLMNTINRTKSTLSYAWRNVKQLLRTPLFTVGDTPVTSISFFQFLLIVLVCWWIAFWLNRVFNRMGNKRGDDKLPAYYLAGRLTYYAIILFGFLYGLTAVGIDFTNFALVAGALAIGLGFGLQSIVNNFVSGLILLFERSIKVGDFIELQDQKSGKPLWGEVKEINVRATIITDNDNVDIVIPNSEFINTKMLNWTLKEPQRRMRYPFRVAYGTDKEIVREVVLAAAEALPHTLKGIPGRNPAVWLVDFKDYYYEFELVVWLTSRAVKRPNGIRAAYMWAIDSALRDNNIEIPVPQREHRFRQGEVLPIERVEQEILDDETFLEEAESEPRNRQ
ncbi:mechanosensitive ion channel domain-containing protein [Ignatzschineria sp. F8392]|uniref:mechanosensitive ion channel domain-containing protein n=1 Tax=Ignatzschineria sp. F8392 TaxID=1980117 RepID=UPI00117AE85A|nr:mechanosensitive ion channel domain-containing protein [Ignatzschineria sp. F8392]